MLLTVLVLATISFLTWPATYIIARREVKRRENEVIESIYAFISPKSDGEASALALFTDQIAAQFATRLQGSIKAGMMGESSAAARQRAGIDGEITLDLVQAGNPQLAALLQAFPNLQKRIKKNPALAGMAIEALAQRLGTPGPGNGHAGEQVASYQPGLEL